MDLSSEKAERCKRIVAACAALKRTILESPQICSVFHGIARRLRHRVRVQTIPREMEHKISFDHLSKLLQIDDWALELENVRNNFLLGGEAITALMKGKVAPPTPALVAAVESFLRPLDGFSSIGGSGQLEHCPEWPGDLRRAVQLLRSLQGAAARDLLKRWFDEKIEHPVEYKRPPNAFHRAMTKALIEVSWHEEARELQNLFNLTLEQLRLAATREVTLKKINDFAWRAADAFLLGPPTEASVARTRELSRTDLFRRKWLPEIFPAGGPNASDCPSSGREPLDKRNTIDPHNQVHTPNSGHTRKPGSRRDNRGHK